MSGGRGGENQSVSGVTTICLTQCNTPPLHRVDQVIDCGLVECLSTPLQWLCEVAGYWQELEPAVVYADPEHPKHAQWVTCLVSMLAIQELGCFQLPGIVYRSLQHGAVHYHAATWGMVMNEWHNNGPQALVTVSLCIQNAINKMHPCLLSHVLWKRVGVLPRHPGQNFSIGLWPSWPPNHPHTLIGFNTQSPLHQ